MRQVSGKTGFVEPYLQINEREEHWNGAERQSEERSAQKLTGENLEAARAMFSFLS